VLSWAQAATWVVTKVADTNDGTCDADCSLREAVAAAADGDTVTFAANLSKQVIILSGTEIVIPQVSLTIDASALTAPVAINANNASRIFNQTSGIVGINRFTINNLILIGGNAVGDGGAVFASANSFVSINSKIIDNQATNDGGGIYANGEARLVNSIVSGNQAGRDGGGVASGVVADAIGSLISGNQAGRDGGGIYSDFIIGVGNTTIVGNNALGSGGGLYSFDDARLENSLVLANSAPQTFAPSFFVVVNSVTNLNDFGVGTMLTDVFVDPRTFANAPTTLGDYRLAANSPAIDAGDNSLISPLLTTDLEGNFFCQGTIDLGAYEFAASPIPCDSASGSVINPNQDMRIRNGDSTAAETMTSRGFIPLRYGPFKRNETVTLSYFVRNPGAKTLELGELSLPPFFSVVSDVLPEQLASFESAVLIIEVDTSSAGSLVGQVSLASNDPDAHENPFIFDVIINVGDEPANALYVLPGVDLEDITGDVDQQNVSVYSARLFVPEGSADVTLNSLTFNASDLPALRDVTSLLLVIDGGTRGVYDARDVVLMRLEPPFSTDGTITLTFPERTLSPNLPLWILLVANF
jgi:CSLREA domain-containing protein